MRPPGVYVCDLKNYLKVKDIKKYIKKAGIELYELNGKTYSPLSIEQACKVIQLVRAEQGSRFLKRNKLLK